MVSSPRDRSSTDFLRVLYPDSNCYRWLDRHLLRLGQMESLEYAPRSLWPVFSRIHLDDAVRTRYRGSHLSFDGARPCHSIGKVVLRSPTLVASYACFGCILFSDASYYQDWLPASHQTSMGLHSPAFIGAFVCDLLSSLAFE